MYDFLIALPAILAVLGFIAFKLLQGRLLDDQIVREIVAKLRLQGTLEPKTYKSLTASRFKAMLEADVALRKAIDDGDRQLLERTLRQQFVIRVIVYVVLAVLFVFGVSMFVYQTTRPKRLSVASFHLESATGIAKGLAVDTDTLVVSWTADGSPEEVRVFLENPRTKKKTERYSVLSSQGRIRFPLESYRDLLTERRPGASNPVRIVVQSRNETFVSDEFELRVGITILLVVWPDKLTIAALVDDTLLQSYDYRVDVVLPRRDSVADNLVIRAEVTSGKTEHTVENPATVDWLSAILIYMGPDDPRIVRSEILIDDSLKKLATEYNEKRCTLESLNFYVRYAGNDDETFYWDVLSDTRNQNVGSRKIKAGIDDIALAGRFNQPVEWFVLWHDTNGALTCVAQSENPSDRVKYPLTDPVTVNSDDPPGTHFLLLLATLGRSTATESFVQSEFLDHPLGKPPEVKALLVGEPVRGGVPVGAKNLRPIATSIEYDRYLKKLKNWLPDEFEYVVAVGFNAQWAD